MSDETRQTTITDDPQTRVAHWQQDEFDVYAGRWDGGGSHMNNTPVGMKGWIGNPYPENEHGRERCIELFRADFEERLGEDPEFRRAVRALAKKTLGCWCQRLDAESPACHAEVIAEHADRLAGENDE